jgi:hypothetical protein
VRTLAAFFLLATLTVAADAPTLAEADALAIRNAQLEQAKIVIQLANLRDQYNTVNNALAQQQQKTRALVEAAIAKVGADKFTLNEETLKFEAKPKPEEAKKK